MTVVLISAVIFTGCKARSGMTDTQFSDAGENAIETLSEGVTEPSHSSSSDSENGEKSTPSSRSRNILESEKATSTPTPDEKPKVENNKTNTNGHHTFNPHIFSKYYLSDFGEKKRDAFFSFCDALIAGADSFVCPDEETYYWCLGSLAHAFFPIAPSYIDSASAEVQRGFVDGVGKIIYKIPVNEFRMKETEFEAQIVSILNDCISDDYTDIEKAMALYEYMCTNYAYDYDMNEQTGERSEEISAYRCLIEKKGICSEIASLYNYLLLQAGVDSDAIGGTLISDTELVGHSWVLVTIDGQPYHIDPTWGIDEGKTRLHYFLMTDEARVDRDQFDFDSMNIGGKADESRKTYDFTCTDERYKDLWEGEYYYIGMNREEHLIVYENEDKEEKTFYYGS